MSTLYDRALRRGAAVFAGLLTLAVLTAAGMTVWDWATRPILDSPDARPAVATFAPIPASSAPQAPHTPPSLTELPFVHGKSQPEVAR